MITKNLKILLVDDFETQRQLIRNYLQEEGFDTLFEAENGEVAYNMLNEAAKDAPFDFVVTDINMPVLDGLGLLQRIRTHSNDHVRKIPVIICSTVNEQEHVFKAITMGVNDYLIKPIEKAKFYEKFNVAAQKCSK